MSKICPILTVVVLSSGCALFESSEYIEAPAPDAGLDATTSNDAAVVTDTSTADGGSDLGTSDASKTDAADAADAAAEAGSDASDGGEEDAGPVALVPFENEPNGHAIIAETGFPDVPDGPAFSAIHGFWDLLPSYPEDDVEPATDADAIVSGPDVMRVRMPAGLNPDDRQWYIEGWRGDLPMTDQVYASVAMKLEGTDWENDASGVELIFFSYAATTNPRTERRLHLDIVREDERATEFAIRARTSEWPSGAAGVILEQNVDLAKRLTVGDWHQIELSATMDTPGGTDGTVDVWIDGHHLLSYSNVDFRADDSDLPFFYFLLFNEWLGPGFARDSTDSFLVDHIRVSGAP